MASPTTTTSNRLLTLPPELRNQIYRYVLVRDHLISLPCSVARRPAAIEPPLLAVNRHIRTEAESIFYGENTFEASDTAEAERWLSGLDDDRLKAVASIRAFHMSAAVAAANDREEKWREALRETVKRIARVSGRGLLSKSALLIPLPVRFKIVWMTEEDLDGYERIAYPWCPAETCGFKRKGGGRSC
ncbi:hypothetical protein LTR36_004245 [Oleoguttula mirabilis]|uniref:F-box domain-containing protein n=1 Tax=Oleoguttula mirabilis TaxID=1507867 RepID=A0AAV9JHJ2_9PEZI|nr:hypothetical protein LTR36_004245 [Oleoguttula mirabilis]